MVRGFIILNFLLGTTWAIGFFINGPMAKYMVYVFVLLNGSVGVFIFIHTVILNANLLDEVKIKLRIIDRSSTWRNTNVSSNARSSKPTWNYTSGTDQSRPTWSKTELHPDTDTDSGGPGTEATSLESDLSRSSSKGSGTMAVRRSQKAGPAPDPFPNTPLRRTQSAYAGPRRGSEIQLFEQTRILAEQAVQRRRHLAGNDESQLWKPH